MTNTGTNPSLMNWGGEGYPSYDGVMQTSSVTPSAPAAAPAAPAAAPSPSPGAAPAASPTAGVPPAGSPPATGAPTASPTVTAQPDPNAPNIEVLRTSHNQLKSLGVDFATAQTYTQTMGKLFTEAQTLAGQLGYTPESFQDAWKADPVEVLSVLRAEAREATRRQESEPLTRDTIRDTVRRETAPLTNFIARQQAESHNRAIDGEFNRLFNDHAVLKSISNADVRQDIRDRFIETVKWNNPVLAEVTSGKLTGLSKVFDEVANWWLKVQTGYSGASTQPNRGAQPGNPAPANGGFTGSLDDIIEGTDKANALPSMRGFR